ncbi:MAG TPA: lysylphosphatidylglycerol synthase domain-containing protein [Candidatus Saccharimonadales bacterium]|nr:lysylphosphatidylglycerol synthase domain-containing protein [Candidatus Saccharimonadales bacterium]
MKRTLRLLLGPVIVVGTMGTFAYYAAQHPASLQSLRHLSVSTIAGLLLLDAVGFLALVLVARASLHAYHKKLSAQENILFNAYSALINFFGPGQSGVIFRGAYLKKRHGLPIKKYTYVVLLYYAFYALLSVLCMLAGARPWWQTLLALLAVGAGCAWFMRRYQRRAHLADSHVFRPTTIGLLFLATLLQIITLALAFGTELRAVGAHASIAQVLAYTGVANFSIFVALTPGAIGIRETFLLFSTKLHHIAAGAIVAANVIDRAVYLLFLGILFVLVLSLHARKKLGVTPTARKADD